jgi:hypothetical protein
MKLIKIAQFDEEYGNTNDDGPNNPYGTYLQLTDSLTGDTNDADVLVDWYVEPIEYESYHASPGGGVKINNIQLASDIEIGGETYYAGTDFDDLGENIEYDIDDLIIRIQETDADIPKIQYPTTR